jgi:YD repeat-containing protein
MTQVTDPLSNSTSYAYDAAGRLSSVTLASGDQVSYTRDENGNATVVSETEVPASGPSETYVTEFDFDVLNRMVEKREIDRLNNQNVLTTTYQYDSRSDLVFRVDAEGNPVRWTYDLASRLVKYERALQVGQTIDDFVTSIDEVLSFDDENRLVEITDDNFNSTQYTYECARASLGREDVMT